MDGGVGYDLIVGAEKDLAPISQVCLPIYLLVWVPATWDRHVFVSLALSGRSLASTRILCGRLSCKRWRV